jgi:hypothetical protein
MRDVIVSTVLLISRNALPAFENFVRASAVLHRVETVP